LQIDKTKQQLVLLLGIIIALVLRGIFIAAGTAIITRFSSAFFIFGAFLIYTAYKLLREDGKEEEEQEDSRIVKFMRSKGASSFTIALITLGVTDLVFALDSIPAIFGITKDPYIVVTANIFALMGLRQLYFLLQGLLKRLVFLSKGLSIILAFIGVKMFFEAFHGVGIHEIAGIEVPHVTIEFSLSVIVATLLITAVASLTATRKDGSEII
jgi:tellurite resistance protein TerC